MKGKIREESDKAAKIYVVLVGYEIEVFYEPEHPEYKWLMKGEILYLTSGIIKYGRLFYQGIVFFRRIFLSKKHCYE